jgi:hypothetical protein
MTGISNALPSAISAVDRPGEPLRLHALQERIRTRREAVHLLGTAGCGTSLRQPAVQDEGARDEAQGKSVKPSVPHD